MRLSYREIEKIIRRLETNKGTGLCVSFKDGTKRIVTGGEAVDMVYSHIEDIADISGDVNSRNGLLPQLLNALLADDPDPESES